MAFWSLFKAIEGRAPACRTSRNQPLHVLANNHAAMISSLAREPASPRECAVGDGSSSQARGQEDWWRHSLWDRSDDWRDEKNWGAHHFRPDESHDIVWQNSMYKPAWGDVQGAALDVDMGGRATRANWRSLDGLDPGRPAGYGRGVTAETVSKLCDEGHLSEAVEALSVLVQSDSCISKSLFHTVLKKCVVDKDPVMGRCVHALTVKKGHQSDTFLCNHMMRMYASHGRLQDAMDVFTVVAKPDAFTWSCIIFVHVKLGQDKQAIQCVSNGLG